MDIERAQHWQTIEASVAKMTDRLGAPIDEGICHMVTALNALGLYTTSSCEGHLEHGLAYPWVDLEQPETVPLARKAADLLDAAQQALPDQERYHALLREANQIEEEAKQLSLSMAQKLMHYLHAFYQQHPFEYERHLIPDTRMWGGEIRLRSLGAEFQELMDEPTKAQRLPLYREEMDAFAAFLTTLFFSTD